MTNMASAQVDYSVYANIVYRFTKYIDWPDRMKNGDFVIGIIGESEIYEELVSITRNKKVNGQPIVIKRLSPNAKSYNAHILFIADEESNSTRYIAGVVSGKGTLLVSERHGLVERGACINFIVIGDNLKLEIGKTNIERQNLNIASELLSLGKIVN
jgi:hypothetical protein